VEPPRDHQRRTNTTPSLPVRRGVYRRPINVVRYETLLVGFTDAVHRFETTAKAINPIEVTVALFEALNWSILLEDHVREYWKPDGESLDWGWREQLGHGSEVMGGVRFTRNRVHHQRAASVRLDSSGFQFPLTFPLAFREWVWVDADDLPPRPRRRASRSTAPRCSGWRPGRRSTSSTGPSTPSST
jgi:hypothetical protein